MDDAACLNQTDGLVRKMSGMQLSDEPEAEKWATVICGEQKYHIRQSLLCEQSEIFRIALDGRWIESRNATFDLSEDDPEVVRALFQYFDQDHYAELAIDDRLQPSAEALLFHSKVYALAERYFLQGLKDLAITRFEAAWLGAKLAMAVGEPRSVCAIVRAAEHVYSSTVDGDRGLRDVLVQGILGSVWKEGERAPKWCGALMADLAVVPAPKLCQKEIVHVEANSEELDLGWLDRLLIID